jgi:hypothetical protein
MRRARGLAGFIATFVLALFAALAPDRTRAQTGRSPCPGEAGVIQRVNWDLRYPVPRARDEAVVVAAKRVEAAASGPAPRSPT